MKKRITKRIIFIITMVTLFAISLKSQVFALTPEQITALDNAMNNGGTLNITTSSANRDKTLNINSQNNVFCIEGSKKLETERDYKVIYKIDINDNKATLYNKNGKELKTVTHNYLCRKMGYILNQPEDRVNMFNQGTSQYSQKQMWYWMYFPNWVKLMGLNDKLNGVNYSSYDSSESGNLSYYGYINRARRLNLDAATYANNNKNNDTNQAEIKKVELSTSPKCKTEGNYNLVGPYKLQYKGNIEQIVVKDLDGNDITSKVKYGVYNGTKLELRNSIPNNTKFYICINSSEDVKGLKNLYVKVTKEYTNGYSGSIWFLKAVYNGPWKIDHPQQVIATTGGTSNKLSEDDITVNINKKFTGKLQIKKIDKSTKKNLVGVTFKVYQKGAGWLKIKDNKMAGYTDDFTKASKMTTLDNGLTPTISNVPLSGKYMIVETDLGPYKDLYKLGTFRINGGTVEGKIVEEELTLKPNATGLAVVKVENDQEYGTLQIEKVDEDTEKKLEGIGFKICRTDTHTWVVANEKNGKYEATQTEGSNKFKDGTTFYTDKNGLTEEISKLPIKGSYIVYEVELPDNLSQLYALDKDFHLPTDETANVTSLGNVKIESGIDGNKAIVTVKRLTNKREYISLSGYVWQDIAGNYDNKTGQENNGIYDAADYKIEGIEVKLINKTTGKVVLNGDEIECKATTDKNGYYRFDKIEIDNLANYYVEFTYDGLTYQNVTPKKADEDNYETSSKAKEDTSENSDRNKLNEAFKEVTGEGQKVTYKEQEKTLHYTKQENNVVLDNACKKEVDTNNKLVTIANNGEFTLSATTSNTINLKDYYETYYKDKDVIENINLGLYERAQTDISLVKEVYSAKLSINGFNHVYEYGNYYKYLEEQRQESDFNVAVDWKRKRDDSYTGPIYRSDLNYTSDDKSKELKVSVIYAIDIRNENINTDRFVKVNSIVDYFDTKYETNGIKAGTLIDETTGEVKEDLKVSEVQIINNNKYNKITIDTSGLEEIKGTGENHKTIYVQFNLSKEKIADILDNDPTKAPLDNVVEIASYSTIQNGKSYAAIDTDSIPKNIKVGDTTTYEDDTDKAPSFVLHPEDDRTLSGTVFIDNATTFGSGNVREGNGQYDEGEQVIAGVKVVMTEVNKDGTPKENAIVIDKDKEGNDIITNEKGEFTITGYTPAYYKVSYEWGNAQGYDVKEYKGIVCKEKARFEKTDWYKTEDPRYSDAMDDYTVREKIDAGEDIKSMTSTTPVFGVGIDANGATDTNITTSSDGDKFVRQDSKYLDFGIIERAKQALEISKTVGTVKITDASGRVLVDATVNSEGKLEGQIAGVTGGPELGFIKAEIDNEAIQGSTAQIGYKITVKNNGELDYADKDFYLYGTIPEYDENILKLKATNIYDYLDNDMKLDTTKTESTTESSKWEQILTSDVVEEETPTLIEQYFMSSVTSETLEDGTVVVKGLEELQSETMKQLFQEWYTETYTSETTTTTNKLTQIRALKLDERQVLKLEGTAISPKDEPLVCDLYSTTLLSNSKEIRLDNETEITDIEICKNTKDGLEKIPGRNVDVKTSKLYDKAEWVAVTPPTGENKDYTMIIISSISAIVILAAGIVFIKKKVLK